MTSTISREKTFVPGNSGLQFANTKLSSPYYLNYRYIINPNCCECTLRDFDPIKNYFLFTPLYWKTHKPVFVSIEYLQCLEGGSAKSMHRRTFNLFYRDWIADKLANRGPASEESEVCWRCSHAVTEICIIGLSPPALKATRSSYDFPGTPTIEPLNSIFVSVGGHNLTTMDHCPNNRKTNCSSQNSLNSLLSLFFTYIPFLFPKIED